VIVAALAACLIASSASAQTSGAARQSVQDILGFLVTNVGVQTSNAAADRRAATATLDTLTRALLASMTTLPVGTSSGGFTYRFNRALGTPERTTDTFGPFFVERARTSGAGEAALGVSFQYASYRALDGRNLRDGSLVTVANQFVDETQPFDIEKLTLAIDARTATIFGNVGVTDRVDLSAAVPVVQLGIRGTRVNDYRGQTALQASATASTMGVADVALRSKVRLTPDGPGAVAAAVEVRLPTGREQDLLGTGRLAMTYMGLASYEAGPAGVYGNFSIGTGGIGREIAYSGAASVAATPRVTVTGEFLARRVDGIQGIGAIVAPHPSIADVDTTRLEPTGVNRTSAYLVGGIKWNVGGLWLLKTNVLVPASSAGLTARITPTIALDYSFAR
jgi:hypothetical protein